MGAFSGMRGAASGRAGITVKALVFGSFVVIALSCSLVAADHLTDSPAKALEPESGGYGIYRQMAERRAVCANNALYVFVKMHGWDVSYDKVQEAIGGDSLGGKSFLEIRKGCERLGIPAVVLKSPIEELRTCRFPVLAYGSPGRPLSGPRAGQKHFVVLVGIVDGDVQYIDPTSAEILRASTEWLLGQGGSFYYLQVSPHDRIWTNYVLSISAPGLLAVCLFGVFRRTSGRQGLPGPAPFSAVIFLFLTALCCPATRADGGDAAKSRGRMEIGSVKDLKEAWRRPGCDGINSLYLFLRHHGVSVSYDELSEQLGGCDRAANLRDLRDVARQYGLNAVVVQVDLRSLARGPLPGIALLDSSREKGSYFVLVSGASPSEVDYIDGGFVTWNKDDVEVFLRKWRGFILLVQDEHRTARLPYVAWSVAGVLICGYLAVRLRFHQRRAILARIPASANYADDAGRG
ncbi:cysteine peptidase family C39 domain-containing protein [Singulisphaera acidiphila]|uniref:ABC-type bacteriocin/lantibiotic exporter with N-terminal double-glycine peptidase domain n=1 Tax=Singulisphaera acidiphila (strain ATCC BAA-1392 / DSM 18658 / VKM B-2454 / MOB10) TaxID=886293 RepID=L0DGI5_SINAD|nr:cysteine peptidase family C39 domain-containing protein [Singulisphaera acidiphila]AGA28494.1 ABC-type bacteriocin/lantibiotic exporter with N-terminal double-glycine peptidase domain [Singulisphaera acidiphila DSM 18658]